MDAALLPESGVQPTTALPGNRPSGSRAGAQRIRVLVAGKVTQVRIQPLGALPRYEAEIMIQASYRTVVSEKATGSEGQASAPQEQPRGPGLRGGRTRNVPSRRLTSAERMRARASFAAPTSAIALDMPRFEDEDAPVQPGTLVRLVWHGQRTVPGIGAGTRLRCSGLLASLHGESVIYNPRYEIVSRHQ